MDLITSLTSQVMNKALDGLSQRHKAIASNLANVDTPNYRRRDVSFEGALEKAIQANQNQGSSHSQRPASNDEPLAMRATRPEHLGLNLFQSVDEIQPEMIESDGVQFRNDGNSVDVETEMVQLAKNTERYTAIANLQGRSIKGLKSVIESGGG